jgi:uncharacterized damage-inducible protein DinB
MKENLVKTFQLNTAYLQGLLKGFDDHAVQFRIGESNTIGWIIGHIVLYRAKMLQTLKKAVEIKGAEKQFERGIEKNINVEIKLEEALNDFTCRCDEIVNAINELNDAQLKQPLGIEYQGDALNIEKYLARLTWHETFHLGQIDLILAALGKGGIK